MAKERRLTPESGGAEGVVHLPPGGGKSVYKRRTFDKVGVRQ